MDHVLILLAVSVGSTLAAPLLVGRNSWQIRYPQRALFAWLTVLSVGVVTLGAAVGLAIGVSSGMVPHTEDHHTNWDHTVLTVGAWLALGIVGAISVVVAVNVDQIRSSRDDVTAAVSVVTEGHTQRAGDFSFVVIPLSDIHAFAVPGNPATVAVSQGLLDALEPDELRAVLAHENAHLQYRHDLVLTLAEINAACVPWLSVARRFDSAARLLVELIADDIAVRAVGYSPLISALHNSRYSHNTAGCALRAERLRQSTFIG